MLARATRARRPQQQTVRSFPVPAPVGGMNTVASGTAIPSTDAIYLYNLISGEYGLRVRSGGTEWVTNCTGAIHDEMRTGIGFHGSTSSGNADRLFWTTTEGIWPATSSTESPAIAVSFSITTGDAGYGISHAVKNIAGSFEQLLFYTDEANGAYRYSQVTGTWTQLTAGSIPWTGNTAYLIGDTVSNDGGKIYVCDTNGTSAVSGGPTGTGTNIVDGTTQWDWVSTGPTTGVIYESLADQRNGFSANPSAFVFVTEWKSRLWFVERDSSCAWYLAAGAIQGLATRFDFGAKMQHGGPLAGLYPWSYDGGEGVDSILVGISSSGDVVAYKGTDPASASTFGLRGSWYAGAVPAGRRFATLTGGELLIATNLGLLPLSKLVAGASVDDPTIYSTRKISNLFSYLVSSRRRLKGWALHVHPEDNVLIVMVPTADGAATEQLVMSFATGGWSRYRGLPALSAVQWAGRLYYGTVDGTVGINTGAVDGVTLADPEAYTPIDWSLLTAYSDLGAASWKQVGHLRPSLLAESPHAPVEAHAVYDLDLTEPPHVVGSVSGSASSWDSAVWDSSIWGGNYAPTQPLQGAIGMGREVAIAVRGSSITRTAYVKTDVFFTTGGLL